VLKDSPETPETSGLNNRNAEIKSLVTAHNIIAAASEFNHHQSGVTNKQRLTNRQLSRYWQKMLIVLLGKTLEEFH
jgi:hypothetical protein